MEASVGRGLGSGTLRPVSLRDLALALAVVAVWGTNFVVIRLGLNAMPPLLFATLRFVFVLLPAVLILPRPRVSWGNLAAYGALIGFGQFGLLFVAMKGHIAPGLASLVMQTQVFFTVGLSVVLAGERIRITHLIALAFGAAGITVIAVHTDATTTPVGIALVLAAAASWAGGNMASKASGTRSMLAYVVWASLFSAPPLFALSLALEGWTTIVASISHAGVGTWAAVLWQSIGNTMFGFAVWAWLLTRYPAATVTPLALLVPVFGMAASAWVFGETFPPWKQAAAILVIAGLAINIAGPRLRMFRSQAVHRQER